ncbi:hypothetical protein GCM10010212_03180 [Paenarthrobacter nicotinovorans]|nr:hypothetical protein GCM10010212_03180 [Paenarthrobacter nicotinovorans]
MLMSKGFADDGSVMGGEQKASGGEGKGHQPQSGMKGWFSRLFGRATAGK